MQPRVDRSRLWLSAIALGLAALLWLGAGSAEARVIFKIPGKGFGHGIGMSQWGAYGFAKQGWNHRRILGHYYRKTKLGKTRTDQIRVLLGNHSSVSFRRAKRACGQRLKPTKLYRADLSGGGQRIRLEKAGGKKIAGCGRKLSAVPRKRIKIGGEGTYRGKLIARPSSGGINAINRVGLEGYVKGVVPNEVVSSWPGAALRAQAVAARTYALATDVGGPGFDQYNDTRSQVYNGVKSEERSTNKATRRTRRQVVKYRGDVVPTFFFSTSGGRTENIEYGFPGAARQPYLKSVRDPYDKASPVHSWTVRYTRGEMESRLGGLVKGRLRRIKITKTGKSPRIVKAKVIGSRGSSRTTGPDLRNLLDLRSTWAKFKKVRR